VINSWRISVFRWLNCDLYVYVWITAVEEMDKNDEELRESIVKLWPIQGPKMHTLLVPPNEGNSLIPLLTGS